MDLIWRRLCLGMFYLIELVKGTTSEAWNYLFRAENVWWRCAQYSVIAFWG